MSILEGSKTFQILLWVFHEENFNWVVIWKASLPPELVWIYSASLSNIVVMYNLYVLRDLTFMNHTRKKCTSSLKLLQVFSETWNYGSNHLYNYKNWIIYDISLQWLVSLIQNLQIFVYYDTKAFCRNCMDFHTVPENQITCSFLHLGNELFMSRLLQAAKNIVWRTRKEKIISLSSKTRYYLVTWRKRKK